MSPAGPTACSRSPGSGAGQDRCTACRGPSFRSSGSRPCRRRQRWTSVTPKKLRARKSTGGWRTNVARTRTKAVGDGQEPRPGADGQDDAAHDEPPDADLGQRASRSRRRTATSRPGTDEVRHHPAPEPGEERAEVEASPARRFARRPTARATSARARRAHRSAGSGTPRHPGRPAARRWPRTPTGERAAGRQEEIELGQVGRVRAVLRRAGRAGRRRRSPNATSSRARIARIGQTPAEPNGTHSKVIIAGAATTAGGMNRPPRGENAMMNEPR